MNISFHGAARTVTGSKHLIKLDNGKQILLDCGMFQGLGHETLQLNSEWGFEPRDVTYVILSHAHIDHVGLLPKLVKDGFTGKVFCTPATAGLATLLMGDSARIQESDVAHVNKIRDRQNRPHVTPLYTEADAQKAADLFQTLAYDEWLTIDDEVELMYTDCGHIIGSAAMHLKLHENGGTTRLTFSGDIGRYNDMILRQPEAFPQADFIIMESTYGDKLHDLAAGTLSKLLDAITHTCIEKKGKLIIPAFSVGRTQELLYLLNRLDLERRLPKVSYYVDSPLSVEATELVKHHPECFNDAVQALLRKDDDVFAFEGLYDTNSPEDSMKLDNEQEPCVIISASGMAEAGRVKHHIASAVSRPENTILIVGYCEPHSLGGRLRDGAKQVTIYGDSYDVAAEIRLIASMSAHGDYEDMLQWVSCQNTAQVKRLFLVHGEYEVQQHFRERLLRKGFSQVEIPELHTSFELF